MDYSEEHPMEHTEECDAYMEQQLKAIEEYKANWPDYCRHCRGQGFFYYPSTRWEPEFCDPCSECVEEGKCPRCGRVAWDWEKMTGEPATCPHCGFVEGKTDPLPEVCCICR